VLRFVLKLLHDRVILGLFIEKRYDRGEKGGAGLLDLERERKERKEKRRRSKYVFGIEADMLDRYKDSQGSHPSQLYKHQTSALARTGGMGFGLDRL